MPPRFSADSGVRPLSSKGGERPPTFATKADGRENKGLDVLGVSSVHVSHGYVCGRHGGLGQAAVEKMGGLPAHAVPGRQMLLGLTSLP